MKEDKTLKRHMGLKASAAISNTVIHILLVIISIIWLIPFVCIVLQSFRVESTYPVPYVIPQQWGLDNYIRLFLDDEIFLTAIKNTLVFAAVTGPGSYLFSLFFAWFINELRPKVRAVVTLLFYAPSISGSVYLIWTVFFSSDQYGFANAWLTKLGLINKPILWFQNEDYIVPLIIAVALWTSLGTSFLTLIAGFQVVDRSLYEAGAVDGVRNRWQELWFITLPYMRPQLLLSAILAITGAFGFGGVITALVGFPSPNYCAWTIMHHLEDYGWSRFEMGYASAIATLLFLMMIGCNLLVNKLLRKVGT